MAEGDVVRSAPKGVRLTYDDLVNFPDDGLRHELIDGEHYVTPSPTVRHQRVLGLLHLLIGNYLQAHPIGEALLAPFDVVLTDVDVVEPDLLYVSSARASGVLMERHVRGTPELVVEIGSPGTRRRDEKIKRRLYERTGVSEYWFIDPEIDVVRVYRHAGDAFGPAEELSLEAGDVLRTPLLPDLDLPLAAIFPPRKV